MSVDFDYGWTVVKIPIKITELSNQNCVQPKCVQQPEIYLFHKKTVTKNAAKYWIPLQKTPLLFLHYRSIPPVFEANGQKCEKAQLRKMGLATAPSNYNPSITKV